MKRHIQDKKLINQVVNRVPKKKTNKYKAYKIRVTSVSYTHLDVYKRQ